MPHTVWRMSHVAEAAAALALRPGTKGVLLGWATSLADQGHFLIFAGSFKVARLGIALLGHLIARSF